MDTFLEAFDLQIVNWDDVDPRQAVRLKQQSPPPLHYPHSHDLTPPLQSPDPPIWPHAPTLHPSQPTTKKNALLVRFTTAFYQVLNEPHTIPQNKEENISKSIIQSSY
jgi:hypothetical protein